MDAFFQDIYTVFESLHAEMAHAIEGLNPAALDWTAGPEINSLAVLAVHTAGAESYWLGAVVVGMLIDRERSTEFQVSGLDSETLKNRLAESLTMCRKVLETLTPQDLTAMRISPRNGKTCSVGWSLLHALDHTAQHTGHMQMTRQL